MMGAPTSDGLTVRLRNLPQETRQSCVRSFFDDRIGSIGTTVIAGNGIGNIVDHVNTKTKQTTVTFKSRDFKNKALEYGDEQFRSAYGNGSLPVHIDDKFDGLTTLFESTTGPPNLDIVVLHGLTGHAWNTFAGSDRSHEGFKVSCWLRDELPMFLEDQDDKNLHPRVMTFGYNANIWTNATIDGIDAPVSDLVHSLKLERQQNPNRPLIFIGHSLGGIVIKQVVHLMITSEKKKNPTYITPIKACLFLAVPHRGTGNANHLSHFLRTLDKWLPPGTGPNKRFVKDLERKNLKLASITDEFIQHLNGNEIRIISCYENRDYSRGKGKIVSKESATLEYGDRQELPHPIDANHSDVARFGNNRRHPFMEIASELASFGHATNDDLARQISHMEIGSSSQYLHNYVTRGPEMIPTRQRQPGESALLKLRRYNTILLVDDSSSMEDIPEFGLRPWTETTEALAKCAELILEAGGRLKVHFFNSKRRKDNIASVEELKTFCAEIDPVGRVTPTCQRLTEHLDDYVCALQQVNVGQHARFPGLNLLIFTDGAPEGRFKDIERVIVKTAKYLDNFRPTIEKHKVGIQFVQIGNDEGVQTFFDRIDNEINGEHKLNRDIVDATRYSPETATEITYMKIVLGAIDKDWDEESITDRATQRHNSQPRHTPQLNQGQNGPSESTSPENSHASQRTGLFY